MYVLRETQEYTNKYFNESDTPYYYGGHNPKYAIGNLEGMILVKDINDAQEFPSFYPADLIVNAHGMIGQFELVDKEDILNITP